MFGNRGRLTSSLLGYTGDISSIDSLTFDGNNFELDSKDNTIKSDTYITMTAPDGVSINQTNNSGYDLNTGTINCSSIDVNGTTLSSDLSSITAQIHWIKDGSNNIYNNNTGNVLVNNTLDLQNNNISNVNTITALDLAGTLTTATQPNITSLGIQALDLDMGGKNITNSNNITCTNLDATTTNLTSDKITEGTTNLYYLDSRVLTFLSGGTMTGNIDMNNNSISNVNSLSASGTNKLNINSDIQLNNYDVYGGKIYLKDGGNATPEFQMTTSNTKYYIAPNDSWNGGPNSDASLLYDVYQGTNSSSVLTNIENNYRFLDRTTNETYKQEQDLNYISYNVLKQLSLGSSVFDTATSTMISTHGNINMNSNSIINCVDPVNNQDCATKNYIDSNFLGLGGGTISANGQIYFTGASGQTTNIGTNQYTTLYFGNSVDGTRFQINQGGTIQITGGDIDMQTSNGIINCKDPTNSQDVATKNYVDTHAGDALPLSGGTMSGAINMGTYAITNASDPTNPQDLATKNYIDTALGSGSSYFNGQVHCSNSSGTSYIYLAIPDGFAGTYEFYWATIFFSPAPTGNYSSTNLFFNITDETYASILSLATGASTPHPYCDTANSVLEPQDAKTIITTFEINTASNTFSAGYGLFLVVSNSTGQTTDINVNFQFKKI